MIDCKHWKDAGEPGMGECALGKFGGRPSHGVCINACVGVPLTVRGLGDVVQKATRAVGLKPCGKCKQRRDKLNKLFPSRASKISD